MCHPVTCGRLLLDTSISAPSSSSAQVVANNPLCGWTRDTPLGITLQAGASHHSECHLAYRYEHFVSVMPAPLASTGLPILLRYQPDDRGRHFLLAGPSARVAANY